MELYTVKRNVYVKSGINFKPVSYCVLLRSISVKIKLAL